MMTPLKPRPCVLCREVQRQFLWVSSGDLVCLPCVDTAVQTAMALRVAG